MKTIAHVVTGLQIGGLERVVVNLISGLASQADQQLVICLTDGGPFVVEVERLGAKVIVLGKRPGMDWRTIRQLAQLLRQYHVQIVHTHNPAPHFHGVLSSLFAGRPVCVHTKHGRNYPGNRKRVLLNRGLSWLTDAIVPVSDNASDVVLQIEKVNPAKVHRIWNGVDTELYKPAASSQKSEVRSPVIGTVARLSSEKDQQTMLQAFKLVLDQWTQPLSLQPSTLPRLTFVGDGPCMAELRNEANHLEIVSQVDFLGARNDISQLLNTLTLFTLSSITEGISMTILEAMSCGLPIVATDVGGNREIVNPPECGLIVPPCDPQALAEAYLTLLRDPARRAQMGAAGRQRAIKHFSLDSMVSAYVNLYNELLSTSGMPLK